MKWVDAIKSVKKENATIWKGGGWRWGCSGCVHLGSVD